MHSLQILTQQIMPAFQETVCTGVTLGATPVQTIPASYSST
jgi:hypothetical protein